MIELLKKGRVLLCRVLEYALILAVLILVLDVLWGVLTRWSGTFVVWLEQHNITAFSFLPDGQDQRTEELARFLLIWVALLGGAAAFGEKAHLGVDYFVGKLHPAAAKLMAVVSIVCVLFFAVSIFILGGSKIVAANMGQFAPALGRYGLKMGHVYMALPIAGGFIIIFTVEYLLETLFSKEPKKEEN